VRSSRRALEGRASSRRATTTSWPTSRDELARGRRPTALSARPLPVARTDPLSALQLSAPTRSQLSGVLTSSSLHRPTHLALARCQDRPRGRARRAQARAAAARKACVRPRSPRAGRTVLLFARRPRQLSLACASMQRDPRQASLSSRARHLQLGGADDLRATHLDDEPKPRARATIPLEQRSLSAGHAHLSPALLSMRATVLRRVLRGP